MKNLREAKEGDTIQVIDRCGSSIVKEGQYYTIKGVAERNKSYVIFRINDFNWAADPEDYRIVGIIPYFTAINSHIYGSKK